MVMGESRFDSGGNVKSTLIEKELKQLEKIKFKQVGIKLFSKKKSNKLSSMRWRWKKLEKEMNKKWRLSIRKKKRKKNSFKRKER